MEKKKVRSYGDTKLHLFSTAEQLCSRSKSMDPAHTIKPIRLFTIYIVPNPSPLFKNEKRRKERKKKETR